MKLVSLHFLCCTEEMEESLYQLKNFNELLREKKNNPHNKISTITEPWIVLQTSPIPCAGNSSKQSVVVDELFLLGNLTVIGSIDYKFLTKKDVKLDRCGKPNCNCILVKLNALPETWGICHGGKHFSFLLENQARCLGDADQVVTSSLLHSYLLLFFGFWL